MAILGRLLKGLFTGFQNGRSVAFFEENEPDYGVEAAHNGQDPEYPSPAKVLDYDTTEERPKGWAKQRAEEVPAKDSSSLAWMEHVADCASPVRNAHASKKSADGPHPNQCFDVRTQSSRDLQQGKNRKADQVQLPPPERFREGSCCISLD